MKFGLIGGLLLFLGLIMLIYFPIHNAQNRRRKGRAEGTIVDYDVITRRRKSGSRYRTETHYKYEVEYNVDGVQLTYRSPESALHFDEGKIMTVCYNPKKPQDAHLLEIHGESSKGILYASLGCIAAGIIFILMGVLGS